MPKVSIAVLHGDEGSLGDASGKLVGQDQFPYEYHEDEMMLSCDHDRILHWDGYDLRGACNRAGIRGELGIAFWVRRHYAGKILAFLCDAMNTAENHPDITFTGWRVLVSVHRGNGYPVYSLQLFAKNKDSKTKVFSGPRGDNVKGGGNRYYGSLVFG